MMLLANAVLFYLRSPDFVLKRIQSIKLYGPQPSTSGMWKGEQLAIRLHLFTSCSSIIT
jgi:hypothetical protein